LITVRRNSRRTPVSRKTKKTVQIVIICIISVLCVFAIAAVGLGSFDGLFSRGAAGGLKSGEADFSFMKTQEDDSLLDIRAARIDLTADVDLSSADAGDVKSQIENAVDSTNTLSVNAVIAEMKKGAEYSVSDFDAFDYLVRYSSGKGLKVFISLQADDVFKSGEKADTQYVKKAAEKYGADAVLINCAAGYYKENVTDDKKEEAFISSVKSVKRTLNQDNAQIKTGIVFDPASELAACEKWISSDCADLYFADIKTPLESKSQSAAGVIDSLSSAAMTYDARIYCILHNEKIMTGSEWNDSAEIYNQIRRVYNAGTLSGIVYNDIDSVVTNRKGSTVSAYSYFKGFNDPDITALSITKFALGENKDSVIIEGETKKAENGIYIRNSADRSWVKITAGEGGKFSAQVKLYAGRNTVTLKHMNAMYSYTFDLAQDIISNTAVENDVKHRTVTLSCDAYSSSEVYAFINGEYVQLTPESGQSGEGVLRYSAVYKLGFKGEAQETDVSFCGYLRGLSDEVINGNAAVSPYSDNSLGRADMCIVTADCAEVTPASENDDLSVPQATPQIKGSYGYVDGIKLYENSALYCLTSGVKINANSAVYIVGAYKMPENAVNVKSTMSGDVTRITFGENYRTFTAVSIAPQTYHEGYLGRKYNVETCEGEYVDIEFFDVSVGSGTFDFANDTLFSSGEWLGGGDSSVILRLHLRKKGGFYGYSVIPESDGTFTFEFKHNEKTPSKLTVMLDPGHGGYGDSGTYSFGQVVYEEEITYSISAKVKALLEQNGFNVIITRKNGEGFTLKNRVKLAREVKPDVFVSIHCDGASDASAYGTHTFYYRNYSKALADSIHNSMVSMYRTSYYTDPAAKEYEGVDLGTRFFPYAVTRIEECPSVLAECGYLTNENDMNMLRDENGQNLIAAAIAQGIANYFAGR